MPARPATIPSAVKEPAGVEKPVTPPSASHRATAPASDAQNEDRQQVRSEQPPPVLRR